MAKVLGGHEGNTKWPFVNRDEEFAWLRELADALSHRGAGQQPPAVAIEGRSGIGKTELLRAFRAWVRQEHRDLQLAWTQCCVTIGRAMPYAPVSELLAGLEQQTSWPRRLGRTALTIAEAGPSLVEPLAPGMQSVLTAGKELARVTISSGSTPLDSLWPQMQAHAAPVVDRLLEYARRKPTLLIVDDLQACDPSSLFVLDRVLHRMADGVIDARIGLILAYAPDRAEDAEADGSPDVGQLLSRWSTERLLVRRALTDFSAGTVADLVTQIVPRQARGDSPPPGELARELMRFTNGDPIFVADYLRDSPQQRDKSEYPRSWTQLVREQLARLNTTDRLLIEAAAVQGRWFDSATVAELTGLEHDLVLDRLQSFINSQQFVQPCDPAVWSRNDETNHVHFRHEALWRLIENECPAPRRTARHARIAEILRTRFGGRPSWEQRLELARHLHFGGDSCRADSSALHRELAQQAVEQNLSLDEAEQLCNVAIEDARGMPEGGHQQLRLLIDAIELQLSLTEVRWRGQNVPAGGPDVGRLSAEAESAARRLGDPVKLIRATMLRGKARMATDGLGPGLDLLKKAMELAREYGDAATLYVTMIEYGRQASKRNLADGKEQLSAARRLLEANPELRDSSDPVVLHARNLGEIQLGITFFDSGELSVALAELTHSAERLRALEHRAELPIALNYLAQVRAGIGDYPAAIEALTEARRVEEESRGDSGWHAYNTALLAHNLLLAEPDRPDADVLGLIQDAWAETERTWLLNLVPIVRNLYAEILLQLDTTGERLAEAERLAAATVEETLRSGMVRSEIAAHSLASRIRLRRGDLGGATEKADRAIFVLEEVGPMPALRSEEIFYHSAVALAAAGRTAAARELLARARTEIERKASLVTNEALRMRFLGDVALNRAIHHGTGVES